MKSVEKASCPYCGASLGKNARACPQCGSDEETGWSPERYLDGIDLPDENSYDEIRRAEFGGEGPARPSRWWIYMTALGLLALFAIGLFMVRR